MNRILIAVSSIALIAAALLAACGGGSSGMGSGTMGMPTATGASGVVTGFGSVLVNGQEFATDMNTQVLDGDNDDAPSSIASLMVGMTVDVDANASAATMLRFTSAVRGEVDAIDQTGGTVTVLGQLVQTTSGTSFAGTVSGAPIATTPVEQIGDLRVGDYVVVFGYLECTGATCSSGATQVVATLIDEPPSAGVYRVQGYVNNYAGTSFTINGLTVDIATTGSAPTVCNTMNCSFNNGDFVSVRSMTPPTGAGTSSPILAAAEVKLRPVAPTFAVGSTVTIEGPLSQLSGTTFVVRGIEVDASGIASSMMGLMGLMNNEIVDVTGTIASNGMLMATVINVERTATFTMMGPLDSVSANSFSLLGQTFTFTQKTRFGDWMLDVRPFMSTNMNGVLAPGDQVIVSGYPSGSGNVATRVERIPRPATPTVAVEGVVSADNAPTDTAMTVARVAVTLNSSTRLLYPGEGATPTLSGFFAAIVPNATIAVALGAPGSGPGTIVAADAAALGVTAHWLE